MCTQLQVKMWLAAGGGLLCNDACLLSCDYASNLHTGGHMQQARWERSHSPV